MPRTSQAQIIITCPVDDDAKSIILNSSETQKQRRGENKNRACRASCSDDLDWDKCSSCRVEYYMCQGDQTGVGCGLDLSQPTIRLYTLLPTRRPSCFFLPDLVALYPVLTTNLPSSLTGNIHPSRRHADSVYDCVLRVTSS